MAFLGYLATFAMGITLGLMGGGGSILTVPLLVYLFHFTPSNATGYSLFIVGTTALIGALSAIRKNEVDPVITIAFAVPSLVGVQLARGFILPQLPLVVFARDHFTLSRDMLIMLLFSTLMILAATSMIKGTQKGPSENLKPRHIVVPRLATLGFVVGLIAGFVGAGGGFLIIPSLVIFAGLGMRVAIGTSLLIIAIQSLFGFAGDLWRGSSVDWSLLMTLSLIAGLGIWLGRQMADKVNERQLKTAFGWFVLVMGTVIVLEQVFHTK